MSDLVFEHYPLDGWPDARDVSVSQQTSRTTSSETLYRLAEVVIDPPCTSVALTVSEKACGPHALDGRVGAARGRIPGPGKGLTQLTLKYVYDLP